MDIDLVYLWVDGSDPVWRAKKAAYEQGGEPIASEAVAEARFVNNDELKYSLRTVDTAYLHRYRWASAGMA